MKLKEHIIVLCCALISSAFQTARAANELQIQIIATEPCSLIYFIDKLAGKGYPTDCLRQWWKKNHGFTREDKHAIEKYRQLVQSRFKEYPFYGELKEQRSIPDQLEYLAAQSSTVEEFLQRVKSSVNEADYTNIRSIVKHFEPLYESLVWNTNVKTLNADVEQLQAQASEHALSNHLLQVAQIYNSQWPDNVPLVISLVMQPQLSDDRVGRDAHCNGNLDIVEITPNQKATEKWGTIFHELTHSLWMTVSPNNKTDLEKNFASARGEFAYKILQEALATSLGAGWFCSEVNGQVDKFWYDDRFIKGFAEAILPLLKEYLANGRQLDQAFAVKATACFSERFPNHK